MVERTLIAAAVMSVSGITTFSWLLSAGWEVSLPHPIATAIGSDGAHERF